MDFVINGFRWDVIFVRPNSEKLHRSDGSLTVGVTDWQDGRVYLSNVLHGAFLEKVLCHELCHCFCFSFDIHIPIEQEEFMADFISVHGKDLIFLLDNLMNGFKMRVAT